MVHTLNLLYKINKEYVLSLNSTITERGDGILIDVIREGKTEVLVRVGIDLTIMLNRNKITEDDYSLIMDKLEDYITRFIAEEVDIPKLTRIDYKLDVREEDSVNREDLFIVLNKLKPKHGFLKKAGK